MIALRLVIRERRRPTLEEQDSSSMQTENLHDVKSSLPLCVVTKQYHLRVPLGVQCMRRIALHPSITTLLQGPFVAATESKALLRVSIRSRTDNSPNSSKEEMSDAIFLHLSVEIKPIHTEMIAR